ncbi:MAG: ELWxxDGT repeat protein, partial [Prochlorococcaceae cyanobacterium]
MVFTGLPLRQADPFVSLRRPEPMVISRRLQSFISMGRPDEAVATGGRLYFIAGTDLIDQRLWVSDGTQGGTTVIAGGSGPSDPREPTQLTRFRGGVAFTALDGLHGRELWSSDGTTAGTRRIADLGEGALGIYPTELTAAGDKLFFVPSPDYQAQLELWTSDGTTAGTRLVKVLPSLEFGTQVGNLTPDASGSGVYFTVDDSSATQLWRSDGTASGTTLVSEFSPTYYLYGNDGREFAAAGGHLFFIAHDAVAGQELWVSDGTANGTRLLKDINPGLDTPYPGSYPSDITALNGQVFFVALDQEHGVELWKSDGTEAGTVLVKDINSDANFGSYPTGLTVVGQSLFFTAVSDGPEGLSFDLWTSDGTEVGTRRITRLSTEGEATGFYPRPLAAAGSKLVFVSDSPDHNDEIWTTDGTAAGTSLLTRVVPSSEHDPSLNASLVLGAQMVNDRLLYQTLTSSDLLAVALGTDPLEKQLSVVGGLVLLQDLGDGRFWVSRDGGPASSITWGGAPLAATTLPAWQLLAAANDGGNTLLWRHRTSGEIVTWTLDDAWVAVGGTAPTPASSPGAQKAEELFQIDLNSDRVVGAVRTTLARVGDDSLLRLSGSNQLAFKAGTRDALPLRWGGEPLRPDDTRLPGWSAIAATTLNGVTSLLWRQSTSGLLASWTFDDAGNASGGTAPVPSSSDQADRFESSFAIDLNGDRSIGNPYTTIASSSGAALLRHGSSRQLAIRSDDVTLNLRWGDAPLLAADPRLTDWEAVAAARLNGGRSLLWRQSGSGNLATWSFDDAGNATGGTAPVAPASDDAASLEASFRLDANDDGRIGSGSGLQPTPYSATLPALSLRPGSGNRWTVSSDGGVSSTTLSWAGSPIVVGDTRLPGWTPVAAAVVDGVNSLLW